MSEHTFVYIIPDFQCAKCMENLLLPFPDLPEITEAQCSEQEYKGPMDSVPDGWSIVCGCRKCGHVDIYDADWLGESVVPKRVQAKYRSDTNCFCVQLQCARLDCKTPATLHTNLEYKEGAPDLIHFLRQGFFHGTLPCGHPLMPLPYELYRDCHRIQRLW
jgi:hypothetical protein